MSQLGRLKSGREGQASGPRCFRGRHAADRILDHEASRGRQPDPPARFEKDVGRGLLVDDVVAVHDGGEHDLRQPDLSEVRQHLDAVRTRRDRHRQTAVPAFVDELDGSGKRPQPASDQSEVDLVEAGLVLHRVEHDAAALGHAADVAVFSHPDERLEFLSAHRVASLGEELYGRLRQRWFGVHQDSVQVENHSTKMAGSQAGSFDARAIVFDLDGVLVDTMPAIRAAWAEWATRRGVSAELVLSEIHLTALELIQKFAPALDPVAEASSIATRQATLHTSVVAFDGAVELIARLAPGDWAIVTSARREPALRHIAMAGLPVPEVLISAEDTPHGKPDPSGYRLAAERLRVSAADCLAVEDSPAGARAARDAGMHVLGVTNTHHESELRDAHAVIASLAEIEVVLEPTQDLRRMRVRWKHGIEHLHDPA